MKKICLIVSLLLISGATGAAQTRRKPGVKKSPKPVVTAPPQISDEKITTAPPTVVQLKKNDRAAANQKNPTDDKIKKAAPFVYEFSQPAFNVEKIVIEHDNDGKGTITFRKQDLRESLTDPLEISAASLEKIKKLWDALDFLNSTENYQAEKQFPHLGTMKLRRTESAKSREAEFNWTDNTNAKELTLEYQKLGEQFIWIFEITVARENQPLEAPKLMDKFESLLRRNLISDTKQMLPFLRELANDERVTLIARNHAAQIVKKIEKMK